MTAVARPNVIDNPGFLFYAPLGTDEPANTVAGSLFTDAWPTGWVMVGATESGSQFTYSTKIDPVTVAELLDPVKYDTTERSGSMAFAMADWTLKNWSLAINGGSLTVVSGTGATSLGKYEPPDPGDEVRVMLGWEALDSTARIVMRQCINGSDVQSQFQKAPDYATIPVEFSFEFPADGSKPFSIYSAGTARYGA